MKILVFNCGSSSLSFKVFHARGGNSMDVILAGKAHRVGVKGKEASFVEYRLGEEVEKVVVPLANHGQAAVAALEYLVGKGIGVDWIGHRFVHGGSLFTDSAVVDESSMKRLKACLPLAPIHNPISLDVIEEAQRALPGIPQYVTFDSAFHASMPACAYTYALPRNVVDRFGFRKYGFHGLSYSYVTGEVARFLEKDCEQLKMVVCHLGTGGSSAAAIKGGRSIDTSMGYSPLPGLVMSTRSGDVDPMLTIYLMAIYGYHPDELMDLFNKESGLLGLSRFSSDIRDVIERVSEGDEQAELAVDMYVQRLKKFLGGYILELGGIDALAFTDDIGLHNPLVREKVCAGMEWCGLILDREANTRAIDGQLADVSASQSRARVLVVPTEEELVIALDGLRFSGV
jgi:acetate kinase